MVTKGNVFDPNCPTRVILDRIGDKWTVLAVLLLRDGPLRFTELRDGIGRVAPKVLTQTLRRLERDGIVSRTVFPTIPPRVDYALTDLGRSLSGVIAELRTWAYGHMDDIEAARAEYAAAAGG